MGAPRTWERPSRSLIRDTLKKSVDGLNLLNRISVQKIQDVLKIFSIDIFVFIIYLFIYLSISLLHVSTAMVGV